MAADLGLLTVNVTIEGRKYPVKCTSEEAEELKKIETALNRQLTQYRLKYAQLDKQDCLSMALIENRLDSLDSRSKEFKTACLSKLDFLESLLDRVLS